jgi:hypothetical protein
MVGEYGGHVAIVHGGGPAPDQVAYLSFVGHAVSSSSRFSPVEPGPGRRFIATGTMNL